MLNVAGNMLDDQVSPSQNQMILSSSNADTKRRDSLEDEKNILFFHSGLRLCETDVSLEVCKKKIKVCMTAA